MIAKPRFYILWIAIPLLTTLNQACMKLLAGQVKTLSFGKDWLNAAIHTPYAYGILFCEATSFVLWLQVLAHSSISKSAPINAIAYIFILLMSWGMFHEQLPLIDLLGSVLILSGIYLISTGSQEN